VSVLRILLVPILVFLILEEDRTASYVAAAVFAFAAATDGIDGYLARRHRSGTPTGQWLDPLADKVLVATPVILLSVLGLFPVWAAAIILIREGGIVALRAFLGARGRAMPATPLAKVKTTLQLLAIALYILPLGAGLEGLRLVVLAAALAMTVYTGVRYAAGALAWLGTDESRSTPA
jgi:CDP-diacylglycerol---glycerol-3-phosphate 3-phosphatidyltransferase